MRIVLFKSIGKKHHQPAKVHLLAIKADGENVRPPSIASIFYIVLNLFACGLEFRIPNSTIEAHDQMVYVHGP